MSLRRRSPSRKRQVGDEIRNIVGWYLRHLYGRYEGPGVMPFYADPLKVGAFAVDRDRLRERDPDALFQLLITLACYQSRRDVDVMTIQRSMGVRAAGAMLAPRRLRVLVERSSCRHLRAADVFDAHCTVRRDLANGTTTCDVLPTTKCHVKDATAAIGRMSDFGKMPTSAFLHLGRGGLSRWFAEVCLDEGDPHMRAARLVERVSTIRRIGRKLASMFVTAVSVPELGLDAPWAPEIDGSRVVIVDANVAAAISIWQRDESRQTYDAMARWLVSIANTIDLKAFAPEFPHHSPRLVQQAIYGFRSRSNRVARSDACARKPCADCPSRVCPFRPD